MQFEECHIPDKNTFLNPHFYSVGDGGETRAGVGGGGGGGGMGGMGGYNNNDCKRDFFTLRR
jgi:hypothetical protein